MQTRMRLGAWAVSVVAGAAFIAGARDASACGGEFTPAAQDNVTVTSDHRMILSISPGQSTLWDEIEFNGPASSFAWVLPIKGTVTVGLSADVLFASLDALTATEVEQPAMKCPQQPVCGGQDFPGASAAPPATETSSGVTVLSQSQIGPYQTVQLQSSDPSALSNWLTAQGFAIPAAENALVAAWISEGFNFFAMKLAPGTGVSAMRPIRVTSTGASAILPLRSVAIGTGATTGITLWVVADGRYEPQNYPSFVISNSQLVWDWNASADGGPAGWQGSSNYNTVRLQQEAALGGRGWQIESSLELSQETITNTVMTDGQNSGTDVSASVDYLPALPASTSDAGADAAIRDASADASGAAELARQEDLTTLFAGIAAPNARITRMRSDIAHSALTADMTLQAAADQTELSNIYQTTSQVGSPSCPAVHPCSSSTTAGGSGTSTPVGGASATGGGASPAGGGTPSSGGGCTASGTSAESWTAIGALLGLLSFGAARSRRRRTG